MREAAYLAVWATINLCPPLLLRPPLATELSICWNHASKLDPPERGPRHLTCRYETYSHKCLNRGILAGRRRTPLYRRLAQSQRLRVEPIRTIAWLNSIILPNIPGPPIFQSYLATHRSCNCLTSRFVYSTAYIGKPQTPTNRSNSQILPAKIC